MRKKFLLAAAAVGMTIACTACSSAGQSEESGARQESAQDGEEEAEETSGETQESGQEDYRETRLVSVDDVSKYLTLGEYKGIVLDRTVQEILDEDVDVRIQTELENHRVEVGANETVQNGDQVTINFVGTKDGKAFDGGTANNYDLVIGRGGMIDGFEDGIIGMKKGETKDLPLTFPEDYFEPSLAGQEVNFQITLQNFRRTPELTEDWVKKNTDSSTLDAYRESIRKQLEEEAAQNADAELISTAWGMVWSASEVIEYPQKDIDNFVNQYKRIMEMYASQAGMDLEEFIESQGYTEENFEKDCGQYAEYVVKQNMIVQAIMDAEGISLGDPECLELLDQIIEENNAADLAELIDTYGQESVDRSIGLLRVENFIVENAVINEKVANGDLVGVNENGAEGETDAEAPGEAGEETLDEEAPEEETLGEEAPEEEIPDEETPEEKMSDEETRKESGEGSEGQTSVGEESPEGGTDKEAVVEDSGEDA